MTRQRKPRDDTKASRVQAVVPVEDMVGLIRRAEPLIKLHLEYYLLEPASISERRDRIAEFLEEAALRHVRAVSDYQTGDWTGKSNDQSARRAAGHARKLLSDQAKELLDDAKQLRSLTPRMLAILDESITAFVISERITNDDEVDDGAVKSIHFFAYWIKRRIFTCCCCGKSFVSVGSLRGGRPRRTCSPACKQSSFRQRQRSS